MPVLDPSGGVPAFAAAASNLARGDWRSIEAEHGSSQDWAMRGGLVQALRSFGPSEEWVASCPNSALAHAVLGTQLIRLAWDIRGGGVASTVAKSSWGDFFGTLQAAERALGTAVELAPDDPTPWAQSIWSGTGLEVSKDDILQRFSAMQQRDAGNLLGWIAVVSSVTEKWGGSHSLMFDVARRGDRQLPAGSLGRVGIVRAHEERRLYYSAFEKDAEAAKGYFSRADVANELANAASNSVLSDQPQPIGSVRLAQSYFAYGLALAGDKLPNERVRAAWLFSYLGDYGVPTQPWQGRYGANADDQYLRIRALCYRAAGI